MLLYESVHSKIRIVVYCVAVAGLVFTLPSCRNVKPYTTGQVKTVDPDTLAIEQPPKNESFLYWDRIDNTVFQQVRKPLDLNNGVRLTGRVLGLSGKKQADNVNHLDEVPESSWYNYRHYYKPMSVDQIARGPNTISPDTAGYWSIFSAKLEGANPGFFIKDASGNRYLIKFDGINYPELTTSAEVIGTKIFYAAGYNVPESAIVYFDPEKVRINEGVMVEEAGKERPMTMKDYRKIVEGRPLDDHGKIRALASKFVDGVPVGQWEFKGTRKDNPNDRVDHEHRREIRGMRVISSWLNDTDRRDANTMAVYTANRYIKHYVQDFGNTLGANGGVIHEPIYGQAYLVDPRYMVLHTLTLGVFVNNWETVDAEKFIPHPSVGYFRAETFQPGRWVPVHPLPAYENMTLRDAFWGAKQVMSFSDDEIRAIVKTGMLSSTRAEEYLTDVLIKRRDMIGRYWFSRINPLDKFTIDSDGDTLYLSFTDLGIEGKLFKAADTRYEYAVWEEGGRRIVNRQKTVDPLIIVSYPYPFNADEHPVILRFQIVTKRSGGSISEKKTDVYVVLENEGPRVTGIRREE
ncbi:MAG: hypothetical protein ACNA8K_02585 [Cyclonatronaceae bacterium]